VCAGTSVRLEAEFGNPVARRDSACDMTHDIPAKLEIDNRSNSSNNLVTKNIIFSKFSLVFGS